MRLMFCGFALLIGFAMSGCASGVASAPNPDADSRLSALVDPNTALLGDQPVVFPTAAVHTRGNGQTMALQTNSLWQTGSNTFFGDPRAGKRGDILTVEINISDQASLSNSTSRDRTSNANLTLNSFFGIPGLMRRISPTSFNEASPVSTTSTSAFEGDGAIDRSETIRLTVAAMVVQVLPNGNFVIAGAQDVQINHEVRRLTITGVVRPQDITAANTIAHTKIAEARIAYGGRGTVSDVQKPGWMTAAYDRVAPF